MKEEMLKIPLCWCFFWGLSHRAVECAADVFLLPVSDYQNKMWYVDIS